jgi:hypothetical protein
MTSQPMTSQPMTSQPILSRIAGTDYVVVQCPDCTQPILVPEADLFQPAYCRRCCDGDEEADGSITLDGYYDFRLTNHTAAEVLDWLAERSPLVIR